MPNSLSAFVELKSPHPPLMYTQVTSKLTAFCWGNLSAYQQTRNLGLHIWSRLKWSVTLVQQIHAKWKWTFCGLESDRKMPWKVWMNKWLTGALRACKSGRCSLLYNLPANKSNGCSVKTSSLLVFVKERIRELCHHHSPTLLDIESCPIWPLLLLMNLAAFSSCKSSSLWKVVLEMDTQQVWLFVCEFVTLPWNYWWIPPPAENIC